MQPGTIATQKRLRIQKRPILRLGLGLTGLLVAWIGLGWLAQLFAETAWFQEVGYLPLFWRPFWTKAIVATTTTTLSALFLLTNLTIAHSPTPPLPHPPISPSPSSSPSLSPSASSSASSVCTTVKPSRSAGMAPTPCPSSAGNP